MSLHLFYLEALYVHAPDDVGEEGHHVVVAHRHVGDDLLERNLLGDIAPVLLPTRVQLEA